jgi:hypothetical protein
VILFLGLMGYVLILATNFFKFDFQWPFMPGLINRIRVGNLTVQFAIMGGISLIVSPLVARLLRSFLPPAIALPASGLLPFVMLQVFFMWLDMWAPVQHSMIKQRMLAMGIAWEYIASGTLAGISDPASKRHFGLVEDDLGVLWFTPSALVYRGDTLWFDIRPDQLLAIERRASERDASSYFGAVHIILRYIDSDDAERSLMLHAEAWTATGLAKALNRMAQNLEVWWQQARAQNLTVSAAPAS